MKVESVGTSQQLKIDDLDFQTMPAGATSVVHPGLLGVAVFLIIFG